MNYAIRSSLYLLLLILDNIVSSDRVSVSSEVSQYGTIIDNIYKYIQYEYETLWTWFLFSEVRLLVRQTCVETCQIVLFSCFVLLPGSDCLYSVRLTGTRTAQTLSEWEISWCTMHIAHITLMLIVSILWYTTLTNTNITYIITFH